MKTMIKNQTGFISTPILIAILVSILVVAGVVYFGFVQYQSNQRQNIETEQETRDLFLQQQQALEEAQKEINALKTESEFSKERQKALEQQTSLNDQSDKLRVSATFIAERTAMLHCLQIEGTEGEIKALYDIPVYEPAIEGSSVIISAKGEILTNAHVVGDAPLCLVQTAKAPNYSVPSPSYYARVLAVNKNLDIAKLLIISDIEGNFVGQNFKYFDFAKQTPPAGQKVYVAGFLQPVINALQSPRVLLAAMMTRAAIYKGFF